jgi:hypothetical protein
MTATDGFDRILEEWLDQGAPQAPAELHTTVIDRARGMRQRPRWLALVRSATSLPGRRADSLTLRILRIAPTVMLLVLLAALLAVAVWFVGTSLHRVPPPFGPAANGSLLYAHDDDIFIADTARSGERVIVGGPTLDSSPRWSRDGTEFTFLRVVRITQVDPNSVVPEQDIMLMDADGTNLRSLTHTPLLAPEVLDWSPDGAHVAVRHEEDGFFVISIIDTSGSGRAVSLDFASVQPFSSVVWRPPDGAELMFVGYPPDGTSVAIYRIHPDGSGLRQVAVEGNQGDATKPDAGKVSFQDASVSADGVSAIFWNWEPGLTAGRDGSIHLLDLTTGRDRRLVFDPTASTELKPMVRPDGSTIVFERQSADGIAQLMVAPLDGSRPPRSIGATYAYDAPPEFFLSPDGSKILTVDKVEPSRIIDTMTGVVEATKQPIGGLPSWQRRAP